MLVNYAAAALDGHAKNVSIRILPDGDVRMAPLYDLASGLPYDKATVDRRLALAIGGARRVDRSTRPGRTLHECSLVPPPA